jgi:hypothetical protein
MYPDLINPADGWDAEEGEFVWDGLGESAEAEEEFWNSMTEEEQLGRVLINASRLL